MSKKKRHSTSEIEAKLGQAAALSSEGQTQSEIAKALGISVMTFHRWRKAKQPLYLATAGARTLGQIVSDTSTSESDRVSRIAKLQLENSQLRRLVTDLLLEKMRLEDEQHRIQTEIRQHAAGSRAS
jgi:putative transposase